MTPLTRVTLPSTEPTAKGVPDLTSDECGGEYSYRSRHVGLLHRRSCLVGRCRVPFNYVPVMGPSVSAVLLFFFAGLLAIPTLWKSLLPAGLYLLIHVLEGETITPMLLARRCTLNLVLAIISLIFWFWMWVASGAVLSADARHHQNHLRWREASKRRRSFPGRGRT